MISYIFDHFTSAFVKMAFVMLLMLLYSIFLEDYMANVVVAVQWFMNGSILQVVPREGMQFIWDTLLLLASYKMLLWFFSSAAPDVEEGTGGFSSRSLYKK